MEKEVLKIKSGESVELDIWGKKIEIQAEEEKEIKTTEHTREVFWQFAEKMAQIIPTLKGENGKDGKDGKDGVEWKAGTPGRDGRDGKDGKNGENGKSAYEQAVENGFTGTLEEWLASLKWEDGKDGKNWRDGKDGKDGRDGRPGDPGPRGIGVIGPPGPEGPVNKNYFDFITNPTGVPTAEGVLSYNPTEKTLDLQQGNGVIQQIGQEQYWRGKNQTGSAIANGSIVYANGALGASGIMTIAKYIADGSISAMYVLGITTEDIVNGGDGFITTFGKIRGIDTTGGAENWQEGDVLYASITTAGALTNIAPAFPMKRIPIAFVINRHAVNGTIAVRVPTPDQIASEVGYDNTISGLTSTNVKEAIDEVKSISVPYTWATQNVDLWANNLTVDTDTFFIDATTNEVGIGTITPNIQLEVFKAGLAVMGTNSFVGGSNSASLLIQSDGTNNLNKIVSQKGAGDATQRPLAFYVSSTEVMRIVTGGFLGIWTVSPNYRLSLWSSSGDKLAIYDNGSTTIYWFWIATSRMYIKANNTEVMSFNSTWNIGIGTTGPSQKLHVETSTANSARIRIAETWDTTNAHYAWLEFFDGTTFKWWVFKTWDVHDLSIWTTSERIRILASNWNVGIWENAPDYKLDVNGTFGFTPGIGTTVTPVDNGDCVIETTSNTSLTFKVKWSDGTVRTASLILV